MGGIPPTMFLHALGMIVRELTMPTRKHPCAVQVPVPCTGTQRLWGLLAGGLQSHLDVGLGTLLWMAQVGQGGTRGASSLSRAILQCTVLGIMTSRGHSCAFQEALSCSVPTTELFLNLHA